MNALRTLALAALLALPALSAGAPVIDLDAAGALAKLQVEQPRHFETVVRILRDAERLPEGAVPGWLRASYDAREAAFGPTLLASYPPKRRLSFALESVHYRATVVVNATKPVAVPAR